MTVIPEKHRLSRLGHALNAQCRGQDETSPSSLGAIVRRMPCEPTPLPQRQPSGLARPEQLLLMQRYLDFPFVPSFVGTSGGVVLDRVVQTLGSRGSRWWATVTARLRAQKAWLQHKGGRARRNVLLDPANYALSVRANGRLLPSSSVRATLDFDDLGQLLSLIGGNESPAPLRMQAEFKQQMPHHVLTAEASLHGRYIDCDAGRNLAEVPRVFSVDLASNARQTGLRYQAGAFQVVSKGRGGGDVESQAEVDTLRSSKFVQVAATVERDCVVWKHRGAAEGRGGVEPEPPSTPFQLASQGLRAATTSLRHLQTAPASPVPKISGSSRRVREGRRAPYSALAGSPQLSVGGVVGVLGQASLDVPEVTDVEGNIIAQPSSLTSAGNREPRELPIGDRTLWSFWTTKRAFGSAVANLQLGHFTRRFLDFTSLSVKFDAGGPISDINSLLPAGAAGAPQGKELPRSLEGKYHEQRHMFSFSAVQQVFGPVRARVDGRCDVGVMRLDQELRIGRWITSPVRPTLAKPELVYGVDVALPALSGAARLALWYSPTRREGLGEIRIL